MRNSSLAQVVSIALTVILSACSGGGDAASAKPADTASASGSDAQTADITTTDLPDSNYSSWEQLETRKRGLAKESAELANPAKRGVIDSIAVDPYTRADYPDVVKKWGRLVPTINRERKAAAEIASRDARCDGVDNAQITDGGSPSNRHYMVECNNLTRIYFDAKSLADGSAATVRTQADMGAQGILDW